MIYVYDIGNEDFDSMGDAIIQPLSGSVKQVAGGGYDLQMEIAMDPDGKWKHLVPGAIAKVPVPTEIIENAFSGLDVDVYKTNTEAALREGASEPTNITYSTWNPNTDYSVGDKVSVTGSSHRNYKCTYFDPGSGERFVPPYNGNWWTPIGDKTTGAAALLTLPAGTELYFVENYNTDWYKMSTFYGLVGYIKKSQVTYDRHLTPSQIEPRVITEQLFRITEPSIDNEGQKISVSGIHVSYDLAGILIQDVGIGQAAPAMAIGLLMEGMMIPYRGTIATNLTSDANGTYTGEIKGKNGIYALLDPDKGIVSAFDAKFTRDNWDLFLMQKTTVDRGYQIRYGKNARGITWKKNSANIITRVVPVAKDAKGADLYLPEKWIDSPLISNYPVIRMEMLQVKGQIGKDKGTGDGSTWTETDLLNEMRAKAGERFSVDHADEVVHEVTIQIEQLGDTAEYAWLKGLETVLLYDTVTGIEERIGLNVKLYVTEMEWDIVRKKIAGLKLSNVNDLAKRTVTGYNVQNNSISSEKLMDGVAQEIIQAAVDIMPEYADPNASRPATVTVVDGDPTLAWGTRSAVGSVQGTDLHVTMPANPSSASDNDPTLSWGTRSKVGTVGGTDLHVTMPANPASATDGDPTLFWGARSKVGTVAGTDLHVTMPSNPASASDNNPTLNWNTQSKVGTVNGVDLHVKLPANPASASDNNPTLNWNTQSKVGTVNGVDLHVKMPANPASASDNNPTLSWNTQSKVGTVNGVDLHVKMPANPDTFANGTYSFSSQALPALANQSGRYLQIYTRMPKKLPSGKTYTTTGTLAVIYTTSGGEISISGKSVTNGLRVDDYTYWFLIDGGWDNAFTPNGFYTVVTSFNMKIS